MTGFALLRWMGRMGHTPQTDMTTRAPAVLMSIRDISQERPKSQINLIHDKIMRWLIEKYHQRWSYHRATDCLHCLHCQHFLHSFHCLHCFHCLHFLQCLHCLHCFNSFLGKGLYIYIWYGFMGSGAIKRDGQLKEQGVVIARVCDYWSTSGALNLIHQFNSFSLSVLREGFQ